MNTRLLLALALSIATGFAQVPYPGDDSKHGPVMSSGYISTYTGNVHVATRDLMVAGAVGKHGLIAAAFAGAWTLGANHRLSPPLIFGSGFAGLGRVC